MVIVNGPLGEIAHSGSSIRFMAETLESLDAPDELAIAQNPPVKYALRSRMASG